jgi:hypothetical protein
VALKRLTGNTAPYRVVLEMQLLQQAAHGSEFIPSLLSGFRDAVYKELASLRTLAYTCLLSRNKGNFITRGLRTDPTPHPALNTRRGA